MKSVFFAAIGVVGMSAGAHAAALNLVPGRPDVFSNEVLVSYNSSTGLLTATGFTQNMVLTPGGSQINLIGGGAVNMFNLSVTINNDGTIGNGGAGSMSVKGDYLSNDVTLLSAITLSQFGFSNGVLEFVFSATGAGGTVNPGPQSVGVILSDASTGAAFSNFNVSFSNASTGGLGTVDTFVIPTPASAMLGLGGVLLMARRRR